ncbi:MAG: hypothetical protein IKJ15_08615 [Lachnospiraceae bacterium]|nr:hypothetical protein [Lachnospiraceae bacterium]
MKRQKLTPEQYARANKTMSIILAISYIIYLVVEVMKFSKLESIPTMSIVRCAVYVVMIIATVIVANVLKTKKAAMLFMAITFLIAYALLVFGNGAGTLVMSMPALIGFMIYLNGPVVVIGCIVTVIIAMVRSILYKTGGDLPSYEFANVSAMGFIVTTIGAWRATNLLINFSKENQAAIEKEAEHRAEVAETVNTIVEKLDKDFHEVLDKLGGLNEEMETTNLSMEQIAGSSESTAEAIGHQAEMTGEIQGRLEAANTTAIKAKDVTEELMSTVANGKQMADDLYAKSVLVDQNTARISETVEELVQNVEKVSSITASILSISSQTNLLALNASIEAARAGEAGKGFAVVAEQIRTLAEETKVSTEKITEIINELTNVTNETQAELEAAVESIAIQRQRVEEVTESFNTVEAGMQELGNGVESISSEVGEVLTANGRIVESISTLSAASEEVLAGTQMSKETIERTCDDLHNFSKTVEGTFEQLQKLEEVSKS